MRAPDQTTPEPTVAIRSVQALLTLPGLSIPPYQRPYTWEPQHALKLLDDLAIAADAATADYRLGTVVLHQPDKASTEHQTLDIVDGQQRILTLMLLIRALRDACPQTGGQPSPDLQVPNLQIGNSLSRPALQRNFVEITRQIQLNKVPWSNRIQFLLNRCQVVCVTLTELSEAFQFFDAQNSRGCPLQPHDLLKAFHLREFTGDDQAKTQAVQSWERIPSTTSDITLSTLFADFLYRIRRWGRGQPSGTFSNAQIDLFKGVTLPPAGTAGTVYPLAHPLIALDRRPEVWPFQLDQPIVNGRRFFEMVRYYHALHEYLPCAVQAAGGGDILTMLDQYEGRHRTGDRYVRSLFDALLLAYVDRFGTAEMAAAITKIFLWAYRLRLEKYAVRHDSIDVHVLENNPFQLLRDATHPRQFLRLHVPPIRLADNSDKVARLVERVRSLGYLSESLSS